MTRIRPRPRRSLNAAIPGLLLAAALGGCAASEDRAEVVRLSERLFDAMADRDADLARSVTLPGGVLVSVRGEPGSRRAGVTQMAEWIGSLPEGRSELDEYFLETPRVMIRGDVAMLWADYALDVDGQRSHTGTDIFTFVRTDEGWKLATATYDVVPPGE